MGKMARSSARSCFVLPFGMLWMHPSHDLRRLGAPFKSKMRPGEEGKRRSKNRGREREGGGLRCLTYLVGVFGC